MTTSNLKARDENLAPVVQPAMSKEIPPERMFLDHSGQLLRHWIIRLPQGFVAGDLGETGIWRRIQGNARLALRRHDTIYCIAWDESWSAEARVSDANNKDVALSKPRIVDMESRIKQLPDDGDYHIEWMGDGFRVIRNTDHAIMTQSVANEQTAIREMALLHPRHPTLGFHG